MEYGHNNCMLLIISYIPHDTQLMLFISPSNLDNSLLNLQHCLSSLKSWFFHNGLALNSDKTAAVSASAPTNGDSLSVT